MHQSQHGYQQHVPDFSAWGIDGATTQLGMQLGHSAVQAGQNYVQQNVRTLRTDTVQNILTAFTQLAGLIPVSLLKHHFNVSNSYVIHKLRLLVFPWRHKPWSRKTKRLENGTSEWQPPREDINSPDLYIPGVFPQWLSLWSWLMRWHEVMAFVTYVLFVALLRGLQDRFHPEVLGTAASKALAVVIVDFIFVKTGCYILNIQGSGQVLDLIAYGGYKFVG